ncbi:unnamed protein product [Mucor fragilis]
MFYSSTLSISITVFQEFPYQSLDTDQNDINVEMDPTSAIEKGDLIKASGMVVVGCPTRDTAVSDINWFYKSSSSEDSPDPKLLNFDLEESAYISQDEADRLLGLLELYASSPDKIDFTKKWCHLIAASRGAKMTKSICSRMPWIREEGAAEDDEFLKELSICLKDNWISQEHGLSKDC